MTVQDNIPARPSYRLTGDLPTTGAIGELRKSAAWVAWNYELKGNNWSKMPKNPHTGGNASVSNPATWGTCAQARKCAASQGYTGVGYVLTPDDGLTGIDLDHCIGTDWLNEILALGETYAEISPSGTGVRLFVRGKVEKTLKCDDADVEIYANARYLTITGDRLEGAPDAINPAPKTIAYLKERVAQFRPEKKAAAASFKIHTNTSHSFGDDFFKNVNSEALNQLDVWVPSVLPAAKKYASTGAWRVTSRDLGRDLEEDLSLHPGGIKDHGTEEPATAIDIVMQYGDAPDAKAAAHWLCDKMGIDPATLGWKDAKSESDEQSATSDGQPRPNAPEPFDVSHDALAVALGESGWDENARYVAAWNKWLFWNGAIWEVDRRLKHMTLTREFLRDRAKDLIAEAETEADKKRAERQSEAIRGKTTVAAVADFARSNPASVACPDDFDSDRMLLGTPGGVVDLRTGKMRPACRQDMITKQTTASPAPAGTEPTLWLQFLHEVFGGDADVICFMQRAAGYALTGMTGEHKMLFLYGTGRNGKSVFLNTLFDLFGDYARRAPATVFLNSKFEQHSTGLAGLEGKRLVIGSELPKGKSWDEAIIKDLTGGDTMTARLMKQDYHDFDPQLTLFIAGNNQPSFAGIDEAIRARVVLVPFTITIPPEKRDTALPDKLRAEAPAILRWAIDGALQWQRRGLDVPASIAAASSTYFEDEDILGQFLEDEVEDGDDLGFVLNKDLHERFKQWCDEQGLKAWTRNTLVKEMKSRSFDHVRRNHGRGFLHIKLRLIR